MTCTLKAHMLGKLRTTNSSSSSLAANLRKTIGKPLENGGWMGFVMGFNGTDLSQWIGFVGKIYRRFVMGFNGTDLSQWIGFVGKIYRRFVMGFNGTDLSQWIGFVGKIYRRFVMGFNGTDLSQWIGFLGENRLTGNLGFYHQIWWAFRLKCSHHPSLWWKPGVFHRAMIQRAVWERVWCCFCTMLNVTIWIGIIYIYIWWYINGWIRKSDD